MLRPDVLPVFLLVVNFLRTEMAGTVSCERFVVAYARVILQIKAIGRPGSANYRPLATTAARVFANVNISVNPQLNLIIELLGAWMAVARLSKPVFPKVSIEVGLARERYGTAFAYEERAVDVRPKMFGKVSGVGEHFGAKFAGKTSLAACERTQLGMSFHAGATDVRWLSKQPT